MLLYVKEFSILSRKTQYSYEKFVKRQTEVDLKAFRKVMSQTNSEDQYLQQMIGIHFNEQNCEGDVNHFQCCFKNNVGDFCYIVLAFKSNAERSPHDLIISTFFFIINQIKFFIMNQQSEWYFSWKEKCDLCLEYAASTCHA